MRLPVLYMDHKQTCICRKDQYVCNLSLGEVQERCLFSCLPLCFSSSLCRCRFWKTLQRDTWTRWTFGRRWRGRSFCVHRLTRVWGRRKTRTGSSGCRTTFSVRGSSRWADLTLKCFNTVLTLYSGRKEQRICKQGLRESLKLWDI